MKDVVQLKLSVIFYEIKKVEKSNLKVIKLRHTDSGPGTWFVYKDSHVRFFTVIKNEC